MIRWRPQPNFDHAATSWRLQGKHARVDCGRCHTKAGRWMGLRSDCATCHRDPHQPSLGPRCGGCHDERRFAPAPRFQHDKARFALRGAHQQVPCARCHQGTGAQATWTGLRFGACEDCHSEPVTNHSRGDKCAACHIEQGWRPARKGAGARVHELLRFPLTAGHTGVDCVRCHTARKAKAGSPKARIQAFAGLQTACSSCHQDPHGGRFGTTCDDCHSASTWSKPKRKGFDHDTTRFALKGQHARVRCEGCHRPKGDYNRRFKGIAHDRCADCHADVHTGTFVSVQPDARCEACHNVSTFSPAAFDVAAHDKARFGLQGAHRVVACDRCHRPTQIATRVRRARSTAQVAQLVGTTQACEACHKQPHERQFAGRTPALVCTSCHGPVAFAPAVGFDHNRTGMPLTGMHATAACSSCHQRPPTGGAVRFAGVDARCTTCHTDPHAGQFASDGPVRTCTDCHTGTTAFSIARFAHDKTRFALAGRHADVPCGRCHASVPAGDAAVVHYRLGAIACERCHSNPHEDRKKAASAGSAAWQCSKCHVETGWRVIPARVDFDHDRTGVPLTGAHAGAACGGCHRPHAGADRVPRACIACHSDGHRGEQGRQCETCHTNQTWRTPRRFDDHAASRFPLSGVHALVACASCHRGQARDQYRGTPTTCDGCHRNVALRALAFDHKPLRPGCNQCHSTFGWSPATFDHAVFWPLLGAHAAVATDCSKCHTKGTYAGVSRSCVGCHGGLVTQGKTHPDHRSIGLTTNCERCHTPTAWQALRTTWHDPAFPITSGRHAQYRGNCTSCHPAGVGRGHFDCVNCHDGAHSKTKMDGKHLGEVGGYVWDNAACRSCHPAGEE